MSFYRQHGAPIPVFASDRIATVYAHYVIARQSRVMPRRQDVDPSQIKGQLPYVYMLKVVQQPDNDVRFKISLMGTELVRILKQEGKDKFVRELDLGGFEQIWRQSVLCAFQHKLPMVATDLVKLSSGLEVEFEHLALPLSEDDIEVNRIFGCFDFPGLDERYLMANLSELDWSASVDVEVPKRLLITNLMVPLDCAEAVAAI